MALPRRNARKRIKRKSRSKKEVAPKPIAEAIKAIEIKPGPPQPWHTFLGNAAQVSKLKKAGVLVSPFTFPEFPKGVVPPDNGFEGSNARPMAKDNGLTGPQAWATQQVYNGAFFNGVTFMGYTYLSELAQRPEYRRFSEVTATEMTRRWIKLKSKATDRDAKVSKADKIRELEAEMTRLDVQGAFRKVAELDGFFGRAHLYIDTGNTGDLDELKTPIGDGSDKTTRLKFGNKSKRGFLRALKPVEPVWTYPAFYNAIDPLKDDWYKPQSWLVQGTELHHSRLLTFVGREVPDLLKPSYSFGGLSLSQMAKPYVDNWLRTRNAVGDMVQAYTTWVLSTDMSALMMNDGAGLFSRADLFSNLKNNMGLMMLNKDTETFANISANLGGLDQLQQQSQEHMCSVVGIPVVKLLGIQPAGLNASSEGELTTWYEWVEAYQEKFFTRHLTVVLNFIQMSLWGEVDEDIIFTYQPLKAMSAKDRADLRKADAEVGNVLITNGVIDPMEERARIAADEDSPYSDLDLDEVVGQEMEDYDDAAPADLSTPIGQLASRSGDRDGGQREERDGDSDDRAPARADRTQGRASRTASRSDRSRDARNRPAVN